MSLKKEFSLDAPKWLELDTVPKHQVEEVFSPESQDPPEKIALYSQDIIIRWDQLPQNLKDQINISEDDLEFLSQYKPLTLRVWTNNKLEQEPFEFASQISSHAILLAEGLISNHDEWQNHTASYIHRLFQKIQKSGEDNPLFKKDFVAITMSCPGFGGTQVIDAKNTTTEQVSSASYARYINIVTKTFNIKTVAGHSAGGEAVLEAKRTYPENKFRAVAYHPSIGLEPQKIFLKIRYIEKTQEIIKMLLGDLVAAPTGYLEKKIVSRLVGIPLKNLTEAQKQQLLVHLKEKNENLEAYKQKLLELAQPDKFNYDLGANGNADPDVVLVSKNDILTTEKLADGWLGKLKEFLKIRLAKDFELILPDESDILENFGQEIEEFMRVSENWGHDAIFYDPIAQEVAVNLLVSQIEQSLLMETDYYQEMAELMRFLKNNKFPLKLKLVKDSPTGSSLRAEAQDYVREKADDNLLSYLFNDRATIRHHLEQAEILINWHKVISQLLEWRKAIFQRRYEEVDDEVEKKLEALYGQIFINHATKPFFDEELSKLLERQSQPGYIPEKGDFIFISDEERAQFLENQVATKKVGFNYMTLLMSEVFFKREQPGEVRPEISPSTILIDSEKLHKIRGSIYTFIQRIHLFSESGAGWNPSDFIAYSMRELPEDTVSEMQAMIEKGFESLEIKLNIRDLLTLSEIN